MREPVEQLPSQTGVACFTVSVFPSIEEISDSF